MKDLERVLAVAWGQVRPRLLADTDELNRRLARRRGASLLRPIRPWCTAVRASDQRITAWDAILVPDHALDRRHEDHPGEVLPHEVTLDKRLLQKLLKPVDLRLFRGHSLKEAAKLLGRSEGSLGYQIRTGKLQADCSPIGRMQSTTVCFKDRLRDSCGNMCDPPDPVWGSVWQGLADLLADDFEQTLRREPNYHNQPHLGKKHFVGWRWICPGCNEKVRVIFLPRRAQSIIEYMGDEKRMAACDADEPPQHPAVFACHHCHRIRYWSRLNDKSWNMLVTYLSAGLLYGKEVEKPPWWKSERKQAYRPHKTTITRGHAVEKLLIQGLPYVLIAKQMNLAMGTVQGHVRRIYKRHAVHSRRQLQAAIQAVSKI